MSIMRSLMRDALTVWLVRHHGATLRRIRLPKASSFFRQKSELHKHISDHSCRSFPQSPARNSEGIMQEVFDLFLIFAVNDGRIVTFGGVTRIVPAHPHENFCNDRRRSLAHNSVGDVERVSQVSFDFNFFHAVLSLMEAVNANSEVFSHE